LARAARVASDRSIVSVFMRPMYKRAPGISVNSARLTPARAGLAPLRCAVQAVPDAAGRLSGRCGFVSGFISHVLRRSVDNSASAPHWMHAP
jgi:hypothetical protein